VSILRSQWKSLCLILFLPYLQFLGCTLIGGLIGRGIDNSTPDYEIYPKAILASTDPGTEITLVRHDTSLINGEFLGLRKRSDEQYPMVYKDAISRSTYIGYVPTPGESATLRTSGMSHEGVYLGIDVDQVLMQCQLETPSRFRLDSVLEIRGPEGRLISGADLRELSQSGTIPGFTTIAISFEGGDLHLSYESVRTFRIHPSKNAAAIGFGVGLLADVAVVAILVASMNQMNDDCNKKQSCGTK
jgi:hypothetical protein